MPVEGHAKVHHGLREESEPLARFGQPIIADDQLAGRILPAKGAFDLVPFAVDLTIEPAIFPGKRDWLLGVPAVRVDDGTSAVSPEALLLRLGVNASVEGQCGSMQVEIQVLRKRHELGQRFREHESIMLVHRLDRDRTQDEAVMVNHGQLFFPFLGLVPRRAEAFAPFLTTRLEPPPGRREVSSW